jgi:hypothetical protein
MHVDKEIDAAYEQIAQGHCTAPREVRAGGDGLLPCPFCARDVDLINGTGNPENPPRWLVVCEVCGSFHFDENETEQEVCVRWNTRASPPFGNAGEDALAGLNERLDSLLVTAQSGDRFILSSDSAKNIVGIVREWIRTKVAPPQPAPETETVRPQGHEHPFSKEVREAFPPQPAPDALREAAMKLWAKLCHDCNALPGAQCNCVDDIVEAFKEILSPPSPSGEPLAGDGADRVGQTRGSS